jgi:hypothetical protein
MNGGDTTETAKSHWLVFLKYNVEVKRGEPTA